MNLKFGFREADITRRENGVISWLDFRKHMTGGELSDLFAEWSTGLYTDSATMLTDLALNSLITQKLIQETDVNTPGGGASFNAFNLINPTTVDRIDPLTVELTPREIVLLSVVQRNKAQTETELDARLRLPAEVDPWRTKACLGHLAKLGYVTENPPGAYRLII
jgi:hypothetical protein